MTPHGSLCVSKNNYSQNFPTQINFFIWDIKFKAIFTVNQNNIGVSPKSKLIFGALLICSFSFSIAPYLVNAHPTLQ